MGTGLLEMTKLKLVMVGVWQRGQWNVIRDGGNKRELEVEIVEDTVVYSSKVLKFELGVLHMKPFKESNFVVMQERLLKDVSNSLMLLCVHRRVVDMARNDGLL